MGQAGRERRRAGPGRVNLRAGPWEGPGRGKVGPVHVGRAGRERGIGPSRSTQIPVRYGPLVVARRGGSMRTTRVSEARHHGLPGSPRCPRRLPPGREAAAGGHGGTRGGGANHPAKSQSGRRRDDARPGWISVRDLCASRRCGGRVESAVPRTGRPPWLFATRVQCESKGGWLCRVPGPAGPGEQPGG